MSDEIKEILNIVKEFCFDYYIEILLCVNIVALIWTAVCLIRLSRSVKKKEKCKTEAAEELTLSLNIKKADVNIGSVANINEEHSAKFSKESGEKQANGYAEECCEASTNTDADADAVANKSDKTGKVDRFCTSRNGRVYSETEILNRIKE